VVTTGTFLNGLAHVGESTYHCGRNGEAPSQLLGDQLRSLGLNWTRLKTGTIDRPQVHCHIAYTTDDTRRILQESIARSPLYSGQIEGVGPRYCPSIE